MPHQTSARFALILETQAACCCRVISSADFNIQTMQNPLLGTFALFLIAFLLRGTYPSVAQSLIPPHTGEDVIELPQPLPFRHSVASGDPLPDAVILWTRVTPENGEAEVRVKWEIALDEHFSRLEGNGETVTSAERDFTVKIDAQGLLPGVYYYYRFEK